MGWLVPTRDHLYLYSTTEARRTDVGRAMHKIRGGAGLYAVVFSWQVAGQEGRIMCNTGEYHYLYW